MSKYLGLQDVMVVEPVDGCTFCFAGEARCNPHTGLIGEITCKAATDENGKYKIDKHPQDHNRPDWCPRKPMPDRKYFDVNMIFSSDDYMTEEIVENLEAYAWNACLDEILKGENGGGADE